jgi:hypothetical protein
LICCAESMGLECREFPCLFSYAFRGL